MFHHFTSSMSAAIGLSQRQLFLLLLSGSLLVSAASHHYKEVEEQPESLVRALKGIAALRDYGFTVLIYPPKFSQRLPEKRGHFLLKKQGLFLDGLKQHNFMANSNFNPNSFKSIASSEGQSRVWRYGRRKRS